MDRIESFQMDHTKLKPGLYVSRVDEIGGQSVTTYDIRMKKPNGEPVMSTAVIHSLEHLGATYLRGLEHERVIYFGPMGCRTGFYMILAGEPDPQHALGLVNGMMDYVIEAEAVPGASEAECGNAVDHDLPGAQEEAVNFQTGVLDLISDEGGLAFEYER